MKPDFETILDECLSRMCAGQSVEECLAAYPAQAEDLQPLLSVFKEMQTVPEPLERSEAVRTGRQRMLVALDVRESRAPVSFGWFSRYAEQIHQKLRPQEAQTTRSTKEINMKLVLRFALALVASLVIGTQIVFAASYSSLPGDTLYPVKLSWEQLQLNLTPDQEGRQDIEASLDQTRIQEAQNLMNQQRPATVEFKGYLSSMDDANHTIDVWGMTVHITAGTTLKGDLQVGVYVHIVASVDNHGQLIAQLVEVIPTPTTPVKLQGYVSDVTDSGFMVMGVEVKINSATTIDGNLAADSYVQVEAKVAPDGTVTALSVKVLKDPFPCRDNRCLFPSATPTFQGTPSLQTTGTLPSHKPRPTTTAWPTGWPIRPPKPTIVWPTFQPPATPTPSS